MLNDSHPERTKVSVIVDAESIDMSWHEGAEMLRSAGLIQITGVTRPLMLHAALTSQSHDLTDHSETADFIVLGSLSCSAFGMTTDEVFICDKVDIIIKAHLKLPQAFNAG